MSLGKINKQSGFTVIEIVIGVTIFLILLNIVAALSSNYLHKYRITQNANTITKVALAVQRRNAHDGFLFSFWDENGGRVATNATLTWDQNDFDTLLTDYLVGRENPACGNMADGWNPVNAAGLPDAGAATSMERAALVDCNSLRGRIPYNLDMQAALSSEPNGAVSKFSLYLMTDTVNFGVKDNPENNILNFTQFQQAFISELQDSASGVPYVRFGEVNNLNDIEDDVFLTAQECSARLSANPVGDCDIIITIDFAGTTNGLFKRTDNQDFFLDDVTFGQNVGGVRQTCAYWKRDAAQASGWLGEQVDCAIKAGVNDDEVTLVFDAAQAGEFIVTNEANLNHLCPIYELDDDDANNEGVLVQRAVDGSTPCGVLKNGDLVQLITDRAYVGRLYAEDMIAESVFASQVNLFSKGNGDLMIQVYDSTQTAVTFLVDNNGNASIGGTLDVDGVATFDSDASVAGDFTAISNAEFAMNAGSEVRFGSLASGNSRITMSRNGAGTFTIATEGVEFEILAGNNNQGVSLQNNAGDVEVRIKANDGVVAENGTSFYASKSTMRNANFDPTDGITTDAEKALSELVTSDMAKMLDDTSSPIQIVGIDRIEGTFTTLTKPNCLWFTADANYSSPAANPYRELIDSGALSNGEDYARLVLLPMYFKTYNSAFGDNQIYAQHASHSTPTTWDIFLYLSGEGAFGTGAREDGAGGSLAMTLCDYSSIDFSRQTF